MTGRERLKLAGKTPLTWRFAVERVTGIEPALSAWEADVLPLNYTRAAPRLAPTSYRNQRPARPGRQARYGLPIPPRRARYPARPGPAVTPRRPRPRTGAAGPATR